MIWPQGGDIPFVWQTALRDIGNVINDDETVSSVAVGGWSPDTMDPATMQLYINRENIPVSTFGIEPGDDIIYTLVIPKNVEETGISIFHPTTLPLDPTWVTLLENWDANTTTTDTYTQHVIQNTPPITPQNPTNTIFGNQLQFLGTDLISGELITYWQVVSPVTQPMRQFIHVLDENGEIIAEDYNWDSVDPQNLWQPHWQVGDLIIQKHILPITEEAQLRIGIFNPYTCTPGPCENLLTESNELFILILNN